jgi:hypothetical protein
MADEAKQIEGEVIEYRFHCDDCKRAFSVMASRPEAENEVGDDIVCPFLGCLGLASLVEANDAAIASDPADLLEN